MIINIINNHKSDILQIISEFRKINEETMIKAFTNGYCYWFALCLKNEFPAGTIYFVKNLRHYVFKLNDEYYDITGKVVIKNSDILKKDSA